MVNVAPKNSLFHIKGIIALVAVFIALVGGITLWASQKNGATGSTNNDLTYVSGFMFVAAVLNLVAWLLRWPSMFALTATIFFVAFPVMLTYGEGLRRRGSSARGRNGNAAYAGIIIECIGAALSFFAVPFEGLNFGSIIDIVILVVVAVFDIIGAAIFANLDAVNIAASIFVILAIFALGALFSSRALLFCSCVLSTYFFMIILPAAFNNPSNEPGRKRTAAAVMTFIGMLINAFWVVISLHVFREDADAVGGDVADETTTTNKTAKQQAGQA